MSKSFQDIVEKINQKVKTDKNYLSRERNNTEYIKKPSTDSNNKNKANNNLSSSTKNKDNKNEISNKNSIKKQNKILNNIEQDLKTDVYREKKLYTISSLKQYIQLMSSNDPQKQKALDRNELESIKEKESMEKLQILNDAFTFNENDFKKRRYDKDNVDKIGKKFFKLRFLKNKLDSNNKNNLKNKNSQNTEKNNDSENTDKEKILRQYNSEFILTLEKAILSFNVKNFKESYEILKNSEIIKDIKEYGEFLLVVGGFDKFLIGEFLAKQKYPNDKKEVLNSFIESINMKNGEISFLDCLRFLLTRLILPKDANLILEIIDKFSVNYFEVNKKDQKFVETFKSSDKIYLLVSTILALNTMFTRKDIKNMKVIKKEEFIKMNEEISKTYLETLYDELKKNPISASNDDKIESTYKRLASLTVESNDKKEEKIIDKNNNNSNNEEKSDNSIKKIENVVKSEADKINEEEDYGFNLKEEDKIILSTPQKLYKINKGKKSPIREYVFDENFTKFYYLKKPKKKEEVSKLIEVLNGSEHSQNGEILKYLKNNPSEEQFSNNFVSLIFENFKIDLMSDNFDSAIKWFKAIKNLINEKKNKNKNIKNVRNIAQFETDISASTKIIWEYILIKWNIYSTYLSMKLLKRNEYIPNIIKDNYVTDTKKLSFKNIKNYLKMIDAKVSKDKEIEYSDFINLCYVGFPSQMRIHIWKILIGNPCGIIPTTYEHYKTKIPKINFKNINIDKHSEEKTYNEDNLSNKIINEIINVKNLFINEEPYKDLDKNEIMNKVYNIARTFWVFRQDISFNKSLISIIFFLLSIFEDETDTFCNIVNLICSNTLSIFIGDENEIKLYFEYFNKLLEEYLPKISNQFKKMEITPELYMIPWFEELFTKTFNYNILLHVFDLFLLNGEYILFQTGLSIIKALEDDFPNLTINETLKSLQRFPNDISKAYFMYNIYSFDKVKKDISEWKFQIYLAKQKSNILSTVMSS